MRQLPHAANEDSASDAGRVREYTERIAPAAGLFWALLSPSAAVIGGELAATLGSMAGLSARPIGPVPAGSDPEQYDRLRRRILWGMPSGLYVLGSRAGGRRNLMTLNWASQVAVNPKLVAVSIEIEAVTHGLVRDGGIFSLNVLPRDQRAIVRKFVKPLEDGGEPAALGGFPLRPEADRAPVLADAVAWLHCEVRQEVPCGSHGLFVGEVVDCGGDIPEGTDVLRMEDTRMSYGG